MCRVARFLMRLSLRNVAKVTTFIFLLLILNIWIRYNVNVRSFHSFDDWRNVLLTSRDEGNHSEREGSQMSIAEMSIDNHSRYHETPPSRSQRITEQLNGDNVSVSSVGKQHFANATHEKEALVAGVNVSNLVPTSSREGMYPDKDGPGEKSHKNIQTHPHKEADKTELKDIFISVKTALQNHGPRVKLLLKTWYLLAREQVYFFTDGNDTELSGILGNHLINTNCSTQKNRKFQQICKMATEFDYYMASKKRWFCHVDDDIYLNVPRLVEMLQRYNHTQDWYLGKPSLTYPLTVRDRKTGIKATFWFATGATFCISSSLALRMDPYAGGGRFVATAKSMNYPDDCAIGYIIGHLLKHNLTVVEEFHSHYENLSLIKPDQLDKQITLSFIDKKVINVKGFSEKEDPTRFRSLHCFLFPKIQECPVPP